MPLPETAQKMVDRVLNGAAAKPLDPARYGPSLSEPIHHPEPDPQKPPTLALKSDMLDAIDSMLEDWIAGEDLEFVDVDCVRPGDDMTNTERRVHRFAYIVSGLWRGDSQLRPMMLARSFVARWLNDPRMAGHIGPGRHISDMTARNALEALCAAGMLAHVGEAKVPGKARPGYLYALVPVPARNRGDIGRELGRPDVQDPDVHATDDLLVARTEFEPAGRVAETTGDDAMGDDLRGLHGPMMPDVAAGREHINAIGGPL